MILVVLPDGGYWWILSTVFFGELSKFCVEKLRQFSEKKGAQDPPITPFWQNYQNHESLLTFTLSFLFFSHLWNKTPTLSSIPFFPPGLQNSSSPPPLIFTHPKPRSFLSSLIHPKPISFKFPAFLPESTCNAHLVYPMYSTPSLSLPQIS